MSSIDVLSPTQTSFFPSTPKKPKKIQFEIDLNVIKQHEASPKRTHFNTLKSPYVSNSTYFNSLPNCQPLELINKEIQDGIEDSFLVGDIGETYRMYKLWIQNLPTVKPFYAIKSNPDINMLKLMVKLGLGFDCASKKEITTMLNLGARPEDIIYANPCKQNSHLRYAKDNKVMKMTFDNMDELIKIEKYYPQAELYLRILSVDCNSKVPFGEKYGAEIQGDSLMLLKEAKSLGLNVTGISFHVGSDNLNPTSYSDTIKRAKIVYDYAKSLGIHIKVLDIGGGFPGNKNRTDFINISEAINETLKECFINEDIEFIAEPGRFFAGSYFTLATTVIGKRKCIKDTNETTIMYYLNDGVFKSFSEGAFIPEIIYTPKLIAANSNQLVSCSLWGPALGAKDKINIEKDLKLPELNLDDWLYFENMGAYSTCFNMEFNGFEQSIKKYVNTEKEAIHKFYNC